MGTSIRPVAAGDIEACTRILYEAFRSIADRHNFPPDFLDIESAAAYVHRRIGHPANFGVIAEADGRVVGFNFLREYDAIRGVGPICVDPHVQARGIGRLLMAAVLERTGDAPGVRLVQDAYNTASTSLYVSLGFDVKEPLALLSGRPASPPPDGVEVRPLAEGDLVPCATLCRRVIGFERINELRDALARSGPLIAVRANRVTGYVSGQSLGFGTHGVAETEEDLRALVLSAAARCTGPCSLLAPTRQAGFFRWCLEQGLRIVKPMTLMALGEYQEPRGSYFPSIAY